MKWIKTYKRFKKIDKIDEKIVFNVKTFQSIVTPQVNKALESLKEDVKPEDIIKWLKSTIMNPKSDTFLIRNMIEELKSSGGVGGSFLPKGYSGTSAEKIATQFDYSDMNYYYFMHGVFDPEFGVLSDPDDVKNNKLNFTGQKNEKTNCGLFYIQNLFQKKFKTNQIPYILVEYCIKKIRENVAQKIKYIQDSKRPDFIDEFQPRINNQSEVEMKVDDEKVPPGCFKETGVTNNIPDLKQVLISCGGRDLFSKSISFTDEKKVLEPIAKKKRLAFYNYFTTKVYNQFTTALNELKDEEVLEYLKKSGVDTQSGKQTYQKGDKVVYLRKDKTIDDWNKLEDFQKENLNEPPASDIIGTGKITEIQDDNIKIEYKDGKFANKTSDEIIKKLKEVEEGEPTEETK